MIPLALFSIAGCLAVGAASDQILAGDLLPAFPEWNIIPLETSLGLAPAPGVQRVLLVPELRRFVGRWPQMPAPEHAVCVTRPVAVLTSADLIAAMQKELPAAHIELLDFSHQPAPEGELVFPVSGLRQSPVGGYWNGYVAYGGKHRFAIWARVKVRVASSRVIAAQDLKQGIAIEASQLRVEAVDEIPASGFAVVFEEAVGKAPRRSIAAGTALRNEWLENAKVVARGDAVQVDVIRGAAHLKLEGIAEAPGAIGDTIPILNPGTKARFPARIESKGRVVVTKGIL